MALLSSFTPLYAFIMALYAALWRTVTSLTLHRINNVQDQVTDGQLEVFETGNRHSEQIFQRFPNLLREYFRQGIPYYWNSLLYYAVSVAKPPES
jgi:hypothetical protein